MAIFALTNTIPVIDPTAWVDESATVIGEVELAAHVNVWPGARLRGDEAPIVVGAGTNVQDNAVIHCDPGVPCILGEDVTVGHGAILHSCTIGNRTLIGMGAIIMNRTTIGNDTLVAAGALIGEGKSFPDGVLIMGRPGKIVRELTPEEQKNLKISAHHYRQQKARYETGLKPVELSTME